MKRLVPALAMLLVGLAVSGCGGSTATPSAQQTPQQQPTPTVSACPKASGGGFRWPSDMPSDLPQPPGAVFGSVKRTADGLTIVRFSTPTSLRDSVIFVVRTVQAAGFTLGRGDAEPAEADAPFGRGEVRGVYKMLLRDACVTDWLVATTKTKAYGTSPLLPTPTGQPGSQPLPFG
jgi:hypothetical protein